MSNAKGGTQALDVWYRKYAAKRDEGREVLLRLRARSRHVPFAHQEDRGAGRHQGHEDPPGARHHGDLRHPARRHQRAGRARRKCATSSRRASPTRSPSRGARSRCSASTRSPSTTWTCRSTPRPSPGVMQQGRSTTQMSAAQKKVIDDHCTNEWARSVAAPWADFEHDGIAKLKADPATRSTRSRNEQLAEWKRPPSRSSRRGPTPSSKAGSDPDADPEGAQGRARQVQCGLLSRCDLDAALGGGEQRRRRAIRRGRSVASGRSARSGRAVGRLRWACRGSAETAWIGSSTPSRSIAALFVGIVAPTSS